MSDDNTAGATPAELADAGAAASELSSPGLAVEQALAGALKAAPGFPGALSDGFAALPSGTLLGVAAAIALGFAAEQGLRLALPKDTAQTEAPSFAQRFLAGAKWFIGRMLMVLLFVILARLFGRLLVPNDPAAIGLGLTVLGALVYMRFIDILLKALSAPKAPGRRLIGFDDADAALAARANTWLIGLFAVSFTLRAVLVSVLGGQPELQFPLLLLGVFDAALVVWFFLRVNAPVTRLFGDVPEGWRSFFARNWVWLLIAIVAVDGVLKAAGVLGLMGEAGRDGAGPVITTLVLSALAIAGLFVWRRELEAEGQPPLVIGATVLGEGIVVLVGAVLMLRFWGVDPLNPDADSGIAQLLSSGVEAGVILAIGIAIWRTIGAVFRRAPEAEEDGEDAGGEGMGGEGDRLGTVMPILRAAALAVVGVTTAMTALAALGVNIGPLIASAGVVGLAVGFGAQKLVADVISGGFYLYEDAFRIGEYVVTDQGKGTVERISLRSATLRHHNGPVYTIPFSSMGTIQNHSRDYVVMKFSFAVPEDTDVERVRKLVKKVGAQLAEDPEIKDKLLAPLKSQGAISIKGRSFEIGCKFTAKPGQQFAIRRKAYAALQKALNENGIELFAPQLTLAPDAAKDLLAADGGSGPA